MPALRGPEEPAVESHKDEDDAHVGGEAFPESLPEEEVVHGDDEDDHGQEAQRPDGGMGHMDKYTHLAVNNWIRYSRGRSQMSVLAEDAIQFVCQGQVISPRLALVLRRLDLGQRGSAHVAGPF